MQQQAKYAEQITLACDVLFDKSQQMYGTGTEAVGMEALFYYREPLVCAYQIVHNVVFVWQSSIPV